MPGKQLTSARLAAVQFLNTAGLVSLTPGFSPVKGAPIRKKRFNGFGPPGRKPLKWFLSLGSFSTGLKPGVNESSGVSWAVLLLALNGVCLFGAEPDSQTVAPKFLGAQSCSSSSCHGGAGDISRQFTVWSQYDFHHHRPFATLETARSERLADVLKLGNPTQSPRCTVCHAPFQTVPAERLGGDAKVSEGVSCESCHGPAENWLRSHTRKDYTHEDRVHAGMRDLKNLYVRANTCVACHQNVPSDIREAGHPELIFELDGQCATMPRHWSKTADKPGPQIWFVGQATALREMSWQLLNEKRSNEDLNDKWTALVYLSLLTHRPPGRESWANSENFKKAQIDADALARDVASKDWKRDLTEQLWKGVANDGRIFTAKATPTPIKARYAERLVLGIDRLMLALDRTATNSAVNQSLNRLFADVQSLPDFDPNQFAKDLKEFHSRVSGVLESK